MTLDLDDVHLEKLESLIDALEDHDDVQDIYTNAS
ncbi:MAG: YebC/PmpR family DNA-binding transcriptional regulator [Candidatus Pacebacteria bacterium]|nr:YebC/PmpR family DNA-binding transcriptional regulator [Candidatus Paceibacterota bacterium]